RSCLTAALPWLLGNLSKCWVSGSNRITALLDHSVSHTRSRSSTYTAYTCGAPLPGGFQCRHARAAGSYSLNWPEFHSLTHSRPRESDQMRRAPWLGVGGCTGLDAPFGSMRAIWLPASDAYHTSPEGVTVMP